MRLWVTEQAKLLCCEWKMDRFFQILEHDVKLCLNVFITFQLPKLTADLSDILMLVCVALRTKLIAEVNANIDKLKVTYSHASSETILIPNPPENHRRVCSDTFRSLPSPQPGQLYALFSGRQFLATRGLQQR